MQDPRCQNNFFVIPAEAGIHNLFKTLDSGLSLSLQVVGREIAGMTHRY
jgi:hypothetical protein